MRKTIRMQEQKGNMYMSMRIDRAVSNAVDRFSGCKQQASGASWNQIMSSNS
jgi:hypothetical protein